MKILDLFRLRLYSFAYPLQWTVHLNSTTCFFSQSYFLSCSESHVKCILLYTYNSHSWCSVNFYFTVYCIIKEITKIKTLIKACSWLSSMIMYIVLFPIQCKLHIVTLKGCAFYDLIQSFESKSLRGFRTFVVKSNAVKWSLHYKYTYI